MKAVRGLGAVTVASCLQFQTLRGSVGLVCQKNILNCQDAISQRYFLVMGDSKMFKFDRGIDIVRICIGRYCDTIINMKNIFWFVILTMDENKIKI